MYPLTSKTTKDVCYIPRVIFYPIDQRVMIECDPNCRVQKRKMREKLQKTRENWQKFQESRYLFFLPTNRCMHAYLSTCTCVEYRARIDAHARSYTHVLVLKGACVHLLVGKKNRVLNSWDCYLYSRVFFCCSRILCSSTMQFSSQSITTL